MYVYHYFIGLTPFALSYKYMLLHKITSLQLEHYLNKCQVRLSCPVRGTFDAIP
jgi:hypothetical protein